MEGKALCLNKPFALLFQFYVRTYQHNDPSVGILPLDMGSSVPEKNNSVIEDVICFSPTSQSLRN